MKWLPVLISAMFAASAPPALAVDAYTPFSMKPYKKQCDEETRPYASCVDQTQILAEGLADAKAEGKRLVAVFGFNDCAPCNVLDQWLQTEEGMLLLEPYVLVKLSIFTPERKLREEVFAKLIPGYGLPINDEPPYGVPHLIVIDPSSNKPIGAGLIGFDYDDQTDHIAYLQKSTGTGAEPVIEEDGGE